jgi:hypothetical protein
VYEDAEKEERGKGDYILIKDPNKLEVRLYYEFEEEFDDEDGDE